MNEIPTGQPSPGPFRQDLKNRLGNAASRAFRFAPELCYGRHRGPVQYDSRPAAVVALLYPHGGQWHIPLTLRPEYMLAHAGQVCFPGGAKDADESLETCALRELREELGVPAEAVRIVGQLPPMFVFASNFRVHPFIAVAESRPEFSPCPGEVAELLEPSVGHLRDETNYDAHLMCRRGLCFRVPHIQYREHRIWGATRVMLGAVLDLLNL